MSRKSELNQLVMDYKSSKSNAIFLKINAIALSIAEGQKRSVRKKNDGDVYYFESAFGLALMKAIKKYTLETGDFENLFSTCLANQIKDDFKADYKNYTSKNPYHDKNAEDDNDKNPKRNMIGRLDDKDEKNSNQYKNIKDKPAEIQMGSMDLYDCMLNAIRVHQKQNPKSRFSLLFTEAIARTVSENFDVYNHINNNSTRYLSTISIDFINSYTKKVCYTVTDIMKAELKPQRDFIEGGSDKPCGYQLVNEVYAQYLGISTARISQIKKEYKVMMAENLN